jgi:hypothetical protein
MFASGALSHEIGIFGQEVFQSFQISADKGIDRLLEP